jgi:predicted cupin superfamily sugar epimerase
MTGQDLPREAADLIQRLELEPHAEGGWFRETWRGPAGPAGRSSGSAIYYLLAAGQHSCWHRLDVDEIWHHYRGGVVLLRCLEADGACRTLRLGAGLAADGTFQALVPAGTWFAAELEDPSGFCLAGCSTVPGFRYDGFQMGRLDDLLAQYPGQAALIRRLATTE